MLIILSSKVSICIGDILIRFSIEIPIDILSFYSCDRLRRSKLIQVSYIIRNLPIDKMRLLFCWLICRKREVGRGCLQLFVMSADSKNINIAVIKFID